MTPSFTIHKNLNIYGFTTLATSNTETEINSNSLLKQNYPNPFNPVTNIDYEIKNSGSVSLSVYNLIGQKVRTLINGFQEAGPHSSVWDGKNDIRLELTAGVYLSRIEMDNTIQIKKMLFLK